MSEQRDKRVILLGKALILDGGHYVRSAISPAGMDQPLVSLGYFDSLQIYPLPTEGAGDSGWMKRLWEHSISVSGDPDPTAYYHPLYIIAPPDQDTNERFWSLESRFLFVTFVHFTFAHVPGKEKTGPCGDGRFDAVSARVNNAVEQNHFPVQAVCYQSMDLSDMVVIWKSDSMVSILQCLNQLYLDRDIGDLHSICSFPLSNGTFDGADEEVPYVSLRLGTRDSDKAFQFSKKLREKWERWPQDGGYFTTGVEDIDVVFTQLPVKELMRLISLLFRDQEINALFRDAFYESATHLGVSNTGRPGGSGGWGGSNALTKQCEELFISFQRLRENCRGKDARIGLSWCKSVSNQLSALVDMSRICVLDGFCYLILDGVKTFCGMIGEYLKTGEELPYDLLEQVQRFVRGWGTLEDQALRADGRLIQSPGFSPTLYDIPVGLLEFYIAFTTRCIGLMQSAEQADRRRHYALFLLPKLCRRTKVKNVFPHDPPHDRLLYVDAPVDLLYDPMQILPQLCHEASHYCGEEIRCREERIRSVTLACAYLLASYFDLGSPRAVKRMYSDLHEELFCGKQPGEPLGTIARELLYMDTLVRALYRSILKLVNSETVYRVWQDQYLGDSGYQGEIEQTWRRRSLRLRGVILDDANGARTELKEDILRIRRLLEEGYADVSMIFLLGLSYEEYLQLYCQELKWLRELEKKDGNRSRRAELVQRAALVIAATGIFPSEAAFDDPELSAFSTAVDEMCIRWRVEDGALSRECFPPALLRNVGRYLRLCFDVMRDKLDHAEDRALIRDIFDQVARRNDIGCASFNRILYEYERDLLRRPLEP